MLQEACQRNYNVSKPDSKFHSSQLIKQFEVSLPTKQ